MDLYSNQMICVYRASIFSCCLARCPIDSLAGSKAHARMAGYRGVHKSKFPSVRRQEALLAAFPKAESLRRAQKNIRALAVDRTCRFSLSWPLGRVHVFVGDSSKGRSCTQCDSSGNLDISLMLKLLRRPYFSFELVEFAFLQKLAYVRSEACYAPVPQIFAWSQWGDLPCVHYSGWLSVRTCQPLMAVIANVIMT